MNKTARKQIFTVILILFIFSNSYAENFSHKLAQVLAHIKNIRQELLQHHNQQANVQKQLQKTEESINSISLALAKTNDELAQQLRTLSILNERQHQLDQDIKKQQLILLQQIRAQYLLGLNKPKTQIILNGKDFEKIERLLTYSHYLTRQNLQTTSDLKKNLGELEQNKRSIVELTNHTHNLQLKQVTQQRDLCSHKQKQQIMLADLSTKVKTKSEQLSELLKNKENLERTIQQLQKVKTTYKSDFLTHHKGKFPWPTEGKILESFGSTIAHSELKQNGVIISTNEGQKVYSVAPGKVIFANRMPGYGLLLIIDHGKGYMTVYGNNGALYKKANDVVGQHDLIAKVGNSGDQKTNLYFALRYQGKPINPSTWCG